MKKVLLAKAHKTMGVIQPFPVVVGNLSAVKSKTDFPLDSNIFIETEDAEKLANGDTVILKYGGACKVTLKTSDCLHLDFLG
jgi:hypothetical protein